MPEADILTRIPKLGSTPAPGDAGRALAASTLDARPSRGDGIIQCARCFPRGRGKRRPGRARSPFDFGIRV
jgi:hypothetical protein